LELQLQEQVDDGFRLHILQVAVDSDGEVQQQGQALPVSNIEIDHEDKACLLQFSDDAVEAMTIAAVKKLLIPAVQDYELCASKEQLVDGSLLRYDTPLIGFGENIQINCFFAVCQI